MVDFSDLFEHDGLNILNILGISAGSDHPNTGAPTNMPDGSRYFRSNGQKYVLGKTTNQIWEEDLDAGGIPDAKLKYIKQGSVQVCLDTVPSGLPYIKQGGTPIVIPLGCV